MVDVYTDGSCHKNPGAGGWAAVIIRKDKQEEITGHEESTTNNRMELMAVIKAIERLINTDGSQVAICIHTDSKYVADGITKWIESWRSKGWKISVGKPVKNADLWLKLDTLNQKHNVRWQWVAAHRGIEHNERADQLAKLATVKAMLATT